MAAKQKPGQFHQVVITGDVARDTYIYEGERVSSRNDNLRATKVVTELGGAKLIYNILNAVMKRAVDEEAYQEEKQKCSITEHWKVINAAGCQDDKDAQCIISYSQWRPYEEKDKKFVWRMSKALGYGYEKCALDPSDKTDGVPKVLVIHDAGFKFRSRSQSNKWLLNNSWDWIVLKLSRPLGVGDLWNELIKKYADKLIVIVSADELRAEDVKIAKGFSWEQTIEDARYALYTAPNISSLTKCRHLIISFAADGALWLNNSNRNKPEAKLLYDTSCAENEWAKKNKGEAFGYMSCLAAAVTYTIIAAADKTVPLDLENGIKQGLSAMRNLVKFGHGGLEKSKTPSGFPVERIAAEIRKPQNFLSIISVPWIHPDKINDQGQWMIAEMLQRSPSFKGNVSLYGLATHVVYYGAGVLKHIPHACFGKYISADRKEIETLRRLKQFMIDYKDNPRANKPISFGVFGPPGAGKSYGVKQIVLEVFGDKNWIEFNLSQFGGLSELYGAFHQVRDIVLTGQTPVVFMDEFDSKKYDWLQYLISPMQDGLFQEGQLTHTVGKCIFIFAGATSYTYEAFGTFKKDKEGREAEKDFILKKGPDFKSRLDAYYNVLGPNQRILNPETGEVDPLDISCPLRRAIFIASNITYSSCLPAPIDPGLVNALLQIPKYKHGARSLAKLLTILLSQDKITLCRSALPADAQLAMYVDPSEFNRLLLEPEKNLREFPVDDLARVIHKAWSMLCDTKGEKKAEEYDKEYDLLGAEEKEDNRSAARRIQDILAMINLKIEKAVVSKKNEKDLDRIINEHIKHHMELLSELEHNGWMDQRFKSGWKLAEKKDVKNKLHNLLIPYENLTEDQKDKDRTTIKNYPIGLRMAGYRINWIKQG
jgi:hypothetical protein